MTMMGNQQRAIRALEFLALEMQSLDLYTDSLFLIGSVDWEFRQGTNCSAPGCLNLETQAWGLESPEGLFSHMSSDTG